jgi:hypothetical protein
MEVMSKTHRGEFKFGKGGSSLTSLPKGGDGRRLVQFYAGGGKVKPKVAAAPKKAGFPPAGARKPAAAPSMPVGALSALAGQEIASAPRPQGMPNYGARARIPGGMKKGGAAHEDVAADKRMVKGAVHKHERAMHPGKPPTKLARGGVPTHGRKPMYGEKC